MNLEAIGKNIKRLREKSGITQNELAKKLFVSFQAVSAWERGISLPDLENAVKMATLFNVSIDTLMRDSESHLLLAIDGGGTKTEFVLFERNGIVRKRVICEGANPNAAGVEKSIDILCRGIDEITANNSAKAIFGGIAGVTTGNHVKTITNALIEKYGVKINIDTDGVNVLAMGKNPENTASVISGTGSCVFVRNDFKLTRLGGWGNLFAPAGSAYKVGCDAITHTLAVNDRLESPTLITKLVEEKLGGNVWQNLSSVYEKGVAYIASFAPLVTEAAEKGEKKAFDILEENAKGLARIIECARKNYGAPDEFVCSGGFIKNTIFKDVLANAARISIYVPEHQPIYGACLECLRLNGEKYTPEFTENFMESYR